MRGKLPKEIFYSSVTSSFSSASSIVSYFIKSRVALGKEECSKLVPREDARLFWNRIMDCNFQKVLIENESLQGCDGYNSTIELSVGLQTLSLSLWCPNLSFYKDLNLTESVKLLESIHDLISYVSRQQVAIDFEF